MNQPYHTSCKFISDHTIQVDILNGVLEIFLPTERMINYALMGVVRNSLDFTSFLVYDEMANGGGMKRRSLIVIPLLVMIILVGSILVIDSQRKPAWRVTINHYITFLRETNHPSYHVESSASATQPGNFSESMSAETYSDTPLFQTSSGSSTSYAAELEPLPYPPEQVMCVLLHDGSQLYLVYVALHNNLYNADWVVHISPDPWGSQAIQFNMSSIGCQMNG